jgi:hypothetical protein
VPLTKEQFLKLADGVWKEAEKSKQAPSGVQSSRKPGATSDIKENDKKSK